jgi:hypothetical protein
MSGDLGGQQVFQNGDFPVHLGTRAIVDEQSSLPKHRKMTRTSRSVSGGRGQRRREEEAPTKVAPSI